MKELEVTFEIATAQLGLSEISSRLGCPHSSGSYEKGSQHGGREPSAITVWRLDSNAARTATMLEHFRDIASRLPARMLQEQNLISADLKICVTIAVYFDTAMSSINLPPECMDIAKSYNSAVEVACYPSSFESCK
jgi:hypothetical protein